MVGKSRRGGRSKRNSSEGATWRILAYTGVMLKLGLKNHAARNPPGPNEREEGQMEGTRIPKQAMAYCAHGKRGAGSQDETESQMRSERANALFLE
jgi:hypothetical protein